MAARRESARDLAGRVLAGRDRGARLPRRRHLREGGRGRAQPRVAGLPPARGGGVGRAAARRREFPRLLDVYDDGDWVALAFEAVDGRPPAHPWDDGELRAAVRALDALHDALTPSPVPGATARPTRLQHLFGGWAELAALDRPPAGLDEWSGRNLDRLAELESGWPAAVAGSTLLHGDVRSDNLLVTSERRRVRRLAARLRRRAGLRPGRLGAVGGAGGRPRSRGAPGTMSAPASAVDPDVVAVLVAAFGGFLVSHSLRPPPPGLPTLRAFQAAQGAVALAWLRAPHRLVTPGARVAGVPLGSRCMRFGLQIPNFTAGETPGALFDGVVAMATAAEETGLRLGLGDGPLLPTAPDGRARASRCSTPTPCSARWRRGRRGCGSAPW